MLKKLRVGIAAAGFGIITIYFLDFADLLPNALHRLAHIQFIPALLGGSVVILTVLTVLSLLFGRVYCSVVCPLGIFQDMAARISRKAGKKKRKYTYSPAKTVLRLSILGVTVAAFAAGFTAMLALLDPYSAYGRMVVHVFRPVYMAGNNVLASVFSRFGNYTFYQTDLSVSSPVSLGTGLLILALTAGLAWFYGRTWCNTVCPVGTLLGYLSKYSLLKIRIDADKCTHCGLCASKCKASCIDGKAGTIDYSRCVTCYNCLDACKKDALHYAVRRKTADKPSEVSATDASKRQFLVTGLAAAALVPKAAAQAGSDLLGTTGGLKAYKRKHAVMPPGAVSRAHFGKRCTSCHLCVSKCPSNVLKPAFTEYGWDGIMQPVMSFEKGFCNFDCTICGNVCPNGAILPLTMEQKHVTQPGRVTFIKENCVVHTDGTGCGACSEHCPTQAISMVPYRDGLTIPHVDPAICVGCGGCEFICPVRPYRAVYVDGHAMQQAAEPFVKEEKKEVEISDFGF